MDTFHEHLLNFCYCCCFLLPFYLYVYFSLHFYSSISFLGKFVSYLLLLPKFLFLVPHGIRIDSNKNGSNLLFKCILIQSTDYSIVFICTFESSSSSSTSPHPRLMPRCLFKNGLLFSFLFQVSYLKSD